MDEQENYRLKDALNQRSYLQDILLRLMPERRRTHDPRVWYFTGTISYKQYRRYVAMAIEGKKQEKESSFFDSYNKKEHENVACTLTMPNHNSAYIIEREASGVYCNQTVGGKQPSIENRVYSPDGTSTAVTASFPTKYNIGLRIRKLTPRECFRLMGVSDDRSQRLISSFPDSVLYHLAGDSIVTTCLMAIFSQCLGIDWAAKAKEAKLVSHK